VVIYYTNSKGVGLLVGQRRSLKTFYVWDFDDDHYHSGFTTKAEQRCGRIILGNSYTLRNFTDSTTKQKYTSGMDPLNVTQGSDVGFVPESGGQKGLFTCPSTSSIPRVMMLACPSRDHHRTIRAQAVHAFGRFAARARIWLNGVNRETNAAQMHYRGPM